MKNMFYIYMILALMLAVTSIQQSVVIQQTKTRLESLQYKVSPNVIKCPKCNGTDVTERSDNPKKLPWTKTMDEIASSNKEYKIVSETLMMTFFTHYLTCNNCGYQVSYNLPY